MAFDLKKDWPILAFAALAIVGFFLLQSSSSGGSGVINDGGVAPADAASLVGQSNALAGQLQEQQLTNNAAANAETQQGVFGLIGDVIGANEATVQSASANATQLSADSIQSQLAEYQAYEQELGTEFGATTNMNTTLGTAGDSLAGELAQLKEQQSITNLFGVNGLNGSNLSQLVQLAQLEELAA